jgi:putative DNA primase/helicase
VTIAKEKQNKNINRDLEEELPGVLNWALEGLRQWQEQGLNDPEVVLAATANYKKDEDPLELFIEEECEVSENLATGSSQLYAAYKHWAVDSGEFVVNSREFKKRMEERGFKYGRNSKLRRFQGIGLLFSETGSDEHEKRVLESVN